MSRPRLFERLAAPARVIVVSAPPGSGKTVLLRSWVAQSGLADRAARVTVGRGERDPQQFWLAVLDALRQTAPGSVLVRPLTAAPDLDGGAIAERLLTDLAPFGGVRSPSLRQVALRLAVLAGYAVVSGLLGALLFGPAMGVTPGYNAALAGIGLLVVFGAATATAGLQAVLGLSGTLLAIIAIVVFGDPTSGQSIATTLLASPWNVIGQGLPPGAGLSAARGVIYLNGANVAGPLTVLATWAAAGTLLMLVAAAWRQRRHATPAAQAQVQAQPA